MSCFIFLCIFGSTFNLLFMKKMILFFSVGILFTTLSSCKKAGCTDLKADNYSSKAKTNDGSCVYSEKLIIWQDIDAAQSWNGLASVLKIYVDGTYLGSFAASEYFNATPDCNSNGQLNKIIDFVKQQGVSRDDIATAQFNIYPQYNYKDGRNNIIGYEARQNISVKVKGVDKSTEILGLASVS